MLTYANRHLLVPGRVEQWLVVIDLENVGFSEIPVNALKGFLSVAQNTFRSRAAKCYVLNAGWLLRSAWGLISSMLDATSREKV